MKDLIMIAGPVGVGKTAVCQELLKLREGTAWLDADWCWMVHPYPGKTEAQKRYAEGAFGYILDGYMMDDNTKTIFFCWAVHADFMFDLVTDRMQNKAFRLHKFVLVCDDEAVYRQRMREGGRRTAQVESAVDMNAYRRINAVAIDVSLKNPREAAMEILRAIEGDA